VPQTPPGQLTALPQTPYLDLRGLTSKGRDGTGRKGEGEEGKGKKREEMEGVIWQPYISTLFNKDLRTSVFHKGGDVGHVRWKIF